MDKKEMRARLLMWRGSTDSVKRKELSEQIAKNIELLDVFRNARHILFYWSVNSEADTHALIERHLEDKSIYLPVCGGAGEFHAAPIVRPLKLKKGVEGIPEPDSPAKNYDDRIDLIVVPGVAFGKGGARLGMGKGYYDRYLSAHPKAVRVGLAYEGQMVGDLPMGPKDAPLDFVVTEKEVYRCKKPKVR